MKNLNPANMAQALMQAQKMKRELEKIKEQIKKEKFTVEGEILKVVVNGDHQLIELNIKEARDKKELEKELIKAFKEIKKNIDEFSSKKLEPFGQIKDILG